MKTKPMYFRLSDSATLSIEELVHELLMLNTYTDFEDPMFLQTIHLAKHRLPLGVREIFEIFGRQDHNAGLLVSGWHIDDAKLGPTPTADSPATDTMAEDVVFHLFGALLGESFGWASYRNGQLIQDIVPLPSKEREQTGNGSMSPLLWHTEEAFHEFRPDFSGLMCLRNPDHVPTTFAQAADLELPLDVAQELSIPQFSIAQDTGHEVQTARPKRVALVFGDLNDPYLRLDQAYTDVPNGWTARNAYWSVYTDIRENLQDIILYPGDMFFMNNHRSVHGRQPFVARFDGTDRWLKRIWLTTDIRKSRALRTTEHSRVIR